MPKQNTKNTGFIMLEFNAIGTHDLWVSHDLRNTIQTTRNTGLVFKYKNPSRGKILHLLHVNGCLLYKKQPIFKKRVFEQL